MLRADAIREVPSQAHPAGSARSSKTRRPWRILGYAALLVVLVFSAGIRWRLRSMPLERDEGEYAYAGQLLLQGIPPYQLAYNIKLPGTYAAYAAMLAVFGQTASGIHLGLMLANACETILIFLIATRLFGLLAGVTSGATYALLSTSPYVLGLAGHATHFVVLAATAGVLTLMEALTRNSRWLVFAAGVLFGLAFLMKQPGIAFVLFAAVWLLWTKPPGPARWSARLRRAGVLLAGAALPFAITCALLLKTGVFSKFWFWTFSYAAAYAVAVPLRSVVPWFFFNLGHVIKSGAALWFIAWLGLTAVVWSRAARKRAFFLTAFLLFSFLAVVPGSRFRPHYFIVMLPAVSLLVGVAVACTTLKFRTRGWPRWLRAVPLCVFLLALAASVLQQRHLLFGTSPDALVAYIYGTDVFSQALRAGEYLRDHAPPSARIAVLGSEPEIYFYSHRHSATGFIYTYPMQENQAYATTMQEEMASEIEIAKPEYLVYVDVGSSWAEHSLRMNLLFSWARSYMSDYYEEVATVSEAANNTSETSGRHAIHILKRKAE
ncbi:MAG TPA: glycosyltransferase family 39 protein [Bryocella sp.]|nr:glycosyltransferase family 39 protein [Bryocella sp.]